MMFMHSDFILTHSYRLWTRQTC